MNKWNLIWLIYIPSINHSFWLKSNIFVSSKYIIFYNFIVLHMVPSNFFEMHENKIIALLIPLLLLFRRKRLRIVIFFAAWRWNSNIFISLVVTSIVLIIINRCNLLKMFQFPSQFPDFLSRFKNSFSWSRLNFFWKTLVFLNSVSWSWILVKLALMK